MENFILRDVEKAVCRDLSMVHPLLRPGIMRMIEVLTALYAAKLTHTNFQIYETWRHPRRQYSLAKDKIGTPSPWHSPHQYGLAVDWGGFDQGKWSWSDQEDWQTFNRVARENNLSVIPGMPGHVQHVRWPSISRIAK